MAFFQRLSRGIQSLTPGFLSSLFTEGVSVVSDATVGQRVAVPMRASVRAPLRLQVTAPRRRSVRVPGD